MFPRWTSTPLCGSNVLSLAHVAASLPDFVSACRVGDGIRDMTRVLRLWIWLVCSATWSLIFVVSDFCDFYGEIRYRGTHLVSNLLYDIV